MHEVSSIQYPVSSPVRLPASSFRLRLLVRSGLASGFQLPAAPWKKNIYIYILGLPRVMWRAKRDSLGLRRDFPAVCNFPLVAAAPRAVPAPGWPLGFLSVPLQFFRRKNCKTHLGWGNRLPTTQAHPAPIFHN